MDASARLLGLPLVLAASWAVTMGCGASGGDVAKPQPPASGSYTQVCVEHTICFAQCPVYKVCIDAHGSVAFTGKQMVTTKTATATISGDAVAKLHKQIDDLRFLELGQAERDGECKQHAMDGNQTIVSVARGSTSRTVYLGGCAKPSNALRKLGALAQEIDRVSGAQQWVRR